MTCGGASEGHAVRSALARRHNELAKQLWSALRVGGMPAMLEQQGWDGSKKRPGDVTCDSEPLVARAAHNLRRDRPCRRRRGWRRWSTHWARIPAQEGLLHFEPARDMVHRRRQKE